MHIMTYHAFYAYYNAYCDIYSREELLSQFTQKPCDSSSVQHEASNAENVKSQTQKVKEEVILSQSSIAHKVAIKEPTCAGASNPSKPMRSHTLVHDRTIESSASDKVVHRSLVFIPNRNDGSDLDEAREVEHAIKLSKDQMKGSQKTPFAKMDQSHQTPFQSGQTQHLGGIHAEQGEISANHTMIQQRIRSCKRKLGKGTTSLS